MANREKLKLEGKKREAPVFCKLRVMLAKSAQALLGSPMKAEKGTDFLDSARHPALEQGKKNVFLAFEIGVKGPARVSRLDAMSSRRAASNPSRAKICSAASRSFFRVDWVRTFCRDGDAGSFWDVAIRFVRGFMPVFQVARRSLQDTYTHVYYNDMAAAHQRNSWLLQ